MKNTSRDFYISKYSKFDPENCDLHDIPMLVRRKLSPLDKALMAIVPKVFEGQEIGEIVFSSKFGEIDRLNSIIKNYQEFNEASPIKFSASVHNYFTGLFCRLEGLTIPYHALSAGENSLSAGLIKSIISDKTDVLFCFADNYPKIKGAACIVSKDSGDIKCRFKKSVCETEDDEFDAFEKFITGKTNIFKTACGIIERVG